MIGGFIVSGDTDKTVVLRAIGPSLVNAGVKGALAIRFSSFMTPAGP